MENGLKESSEKFGETSLQAIENPMILLSATETIVFHEYEKNDPRNIQEVQLTGCGAALYMKGKEESYVQDDS